MVRHLSPAEKHGVEEFGRHSSWHKEKKKSNNDLNPMVAANSFSFPEQSGPHSGFVTLTKNEGGTFSPPKSRPSTPELGRNRTHAFSRTRTPPGYRPRSLPRARTPPRSRARTPPRLRQADIPRPTPVKPREHSPHIRGARSNSQNSSEKVRSQSPVPSFSSMSPNPSDDGRFIPAPFVYEEEIRDPPPQTETDLDTKQKTVESLPWKDPLVAQMSPRRIIDNDSTEAEESIEAESGMYALYETTKTTTKMSSKNQSKAALSNSNQAVKQLGLPFPFPSSMARRNSNVDRNRTISPQRLFRKQSPLRNIRLGFAKSHGDRSKQSMHKQATEMDPACAISCVDPSLMASPAALEIKADSTVEDDPPTEHDSGENENLKTTKLDNDYGLGKVISGAIAYWTRPDANEDAEGIKEESCTEPNPEATVTTDQALEPVEATSEGKASDGMRISNDFNDEVESEHLESDDIVFHVRLNVESFMGVSATHRHFRRSKNDHSLMQGYVEVVNPSIVAENSPHIVASQPDITTAVGTSKHHFFLWPDNIKDKSRNRLYLTLPVYPKQEGILTKYAIATPETVHLRIGVKRGDDLIPLGDAFLEIDIDCPNMHNRTFELPIHPLKKSNKNKIREFFSKRKVNDTSYALEPIALLRCIVQAQPGLESTSGAIFWGDKPPKRVDIEQGVIHELCSHDFERNPQCQENSQPWNNRATGDNELFLSSTAEKFEGQPPNVLAASSFVENTLGECAVERGSDRIEQLHNLPSPEAQRSGESESQLDKVERFRSPASTGARRSETETRRDDVEQSRAREAKFFGHNRDDETGSDVGSVADPGCATFWTGVETLTRKRDPEVDNLRPFIENRSSQSFRRDMYQIPENSERLIDRQSKNLSSKLCQPMCSKIPHAISPTEDVKVTFAEMEDRTWRARMQSIMQEEQHDWTDGTEDGSAVLEVEKPPSKLRAARSRRDACPLATVEEDKFKTMPRDDQVVSTEHHTGENQRDQIATETEPHLYQQTKQQEGPEVKFAIDENQISREKSVKENLGNWVDPQDIAADSFAISENDSLTAESVDDAMSPKPPRYGQGLKPDPPASVDEIAYRNNAQLKLTEAQKAEDCFDNTLKTLKTEPKDETDEAEEFSWITNTTNAADPITNMISSPAVTVDADRLTPDRCITPIHLADLTVPKEEERIQHQPSTKIPAKLPTTRNIQPQLSEEFTEWEDAGPGDTSRHIPFFNCMCDDDVDYASDPEKDELQHVDTSEPLLRNFHSFGEGFETVLDLKRELDQGYSLIATLSNLSRDLFWPAAKAEEAEIRERPSPEIAQSTSSSSTDSQILTKADYCSPTRKDLFPSETRHKASSGFRQPKPLTQKQLSDISSIIESIPSPLSVDSYCSDSKYDEAARKIFRVAKKLGISADSLIDQLEKGEKIERLLSRKIQGRQYIMDKNRQSGRKYNKHKLSGYV